MLLLTVINQLLVSNEVPSSLRSFFISLKSESDQWPNYWGVYQDSWWRFHHYPMWRVNYIIRFTTIGSVLFRSIFPKSTLLFGIIHFFILNPSSDVLFYIRNLMVRPFLLVLLEELLEWLNQRETIVLSIPSYLDDERKRINEERTKLGLKQITV